MGTVKFSDGHETYPTRICLGKNPIRVPSFRYPSRKNAMPVNTELRAYDTSVVANISVGDSRSAEIDSAIM